MTSLAGPIGLDLRSLALLRMGLGATILVDLADRATWLRAHYTDAGVLPRAAASSLRGAEWSLHHATGTVGGQAVLFTIAAVLAALFLVGWRTRVVGVLSWILLVSLHHRMPMVCYGADALLRALLLYALFLPVHARWSIDERQGRAPALPDEHRSFATFAVLAQLLVIYWSTGAQKLGDASWQSLSAVYFALAADHTATPLGLWLSRSYGVTQALSLATLLLDLVVPFFLLVPIGWQRLRMMVVASFVLFHASTALMMRVGYFPWMSCLAWLAVLPPAFWERIGVATRPGVGVDKNPVRGLVVVTALVLGVITSIGFTSRVLHGSFRPPQAVKGFASSVGFDQRWNMFITPLPDGWFVVPARLANGREIDVMRQAAPLTWEKPAVVAEQFHNMRWRKYFVDFALHKPAGARVMKQFLRYVCRTWNQGHGLDEAIVSTEIVFMSQDDRLDGRPGPVVKRTFARRECGGLQPVVEDDSAEYFERKPTGAGAGPERGASPDEEPADGPMDPRVDGDLDDDETDAAPADAAEREDDDDTDENGQFRDEGRDDEDPGEDAP